MKAVVRRLCRLETGMGLVETEENRRARQRLELLRQRIARRARAEGREYNAPNEKERKALVGLTIADVLRLGRQRARNRAAEEA